MTGRPNRWSCWFLAAATPIVLAGLVVAVYGVNVPVGDQWTFGRIFLTTHAGSTTIRDLWMQANESRPLVPRLVLIPLAFLTGWNVRAEMFVTRGDLATSLALLRLSVKTSAAPSGYLPVLWFLMNAILFSRPSTRTSCGVSRTIVYLPFLWLCASALVAESGLSLWSKTTVGVLLASMGTLSYANGMTLWLLVPLQLLPSWRAVPRRARTICFASWVLCAVGMCMAYFADFRKPPAPRHSTWGCDNPWSRPGGCCATWARPSVRTR